MHKAKFAAVAAAVLLFAACSGCGREDGADSLGEKIGDSVMDAVEDAKKQAAEDIKSAVASEINEYFASSGISDSLGIDIEGQEEILNSVREYIDSYEFDAEQLDKAKSALGELLKNAQGFSAEEIKESIKNILGE